MWMYGQINDECVLEIGATCKGRHGLFQGEHVPTFAPLAPPLFTEVSTAVICCSCHKALLVLRAALKSMIAEAGV